MVPGSQPASPNPFGAKAGGRAHVLVRRRIGNGMVIELTGRSALLISGAILAASYLIAAVLTGSAATPRSDAFRPNFDPAGVVILMPPEAPTPRPTRPPERPARPPVPLSTTDLQAL